MKRVLAVLLMLGLCMFSVGCPKGEDDTGGGGATVTPAGNGARPTSSGAKFKEGVASGRAEDGSDEDK